MTFSKYKDKFTNAKVKNEKEIIYVEQDLITRTNQYIATPKPSSIRIFNELLMNKNNQKLDESRKLFLIMFASYFIESTLFFTNPKDNKSIFSQYGYNTSLYGITKEVEYYLRQPNESGKLVTDSNNMAPTILNIENFHGKVPEHILPTIYKTTKDKHHFIGGKKDLNRNPAHYYFNSLFLREHNRICNQLKKHYPSKNGEWYFTKAMHFTHLILWKIVYKEYVLHGLSGYHNSNFRYTKKYTNISTSYNRKLLLYGLGAKNMKNGTIPFEFNLAYRWHLLLPALTKINDTPVSLEQMQTLTFIQNNTIEDVFLSWLQQPSLCLHHNNTSSDMKHVIIATINRAREMNVDSFNNVRAGFGLPKYSSFEDYTSNVEIREILSSLYDDIDSMDFYVGIWFEEKQQSNYIFPETMIVILASYAIIYDIAFIDLFDSEVKKSPETKIIWKNLDTSLCALLERNTDLDKETLEKYDIHSMGRKKSN